jgi:hypothetical protein
VGVQVPQRYRVPARQHQALLRRAAQGAETLPLAPVPFATQHTAASATATMGCTLSSARLLTVVATCHTKLQASRATGCVPPVSNAFNRTLQQDRNVSTSAEWRSAIRDVDASVFEHLRSAVSGGFDEARVLECVFEPQLVSVHAQAPAACTLPGTTAHSMHGCIEHLQV